jgi:hypothetical protein
MSALVKLVERIPMIVANTPTPTSQARRLPRLSRSDPRPASEFRDDPVSRFIERFASALAEAGMPRMPARVFVALLCAREGIDLLGAESPAGARLGESLEFFEFLRAEMPSLLQRWRERNAQPRARRRGQR